MRRIRLLAHAAAVGALALGVVGCAILFPNQPPLAVFTATPETGPAPLAVSFNAADSTDPDGSISTYTWSFGDGQSGVGVSGMHVYANPGTYSAVLTVIDNGGDMATASKTITVTAPENAPPVADISATPTSGPAPLTVSFDATGSSDPDGTVVSYSWDFEGGSTGTGPTATRIYLAAGSYVVILTVTDDDGATDTETVTIDVTEPGNQAPVASFTADPESGFDPLTVTFDATSSHDPDGAITAYQWYFGDGDTGTGAVVTHTYEGFGSYTAILTVLDDDGTPASETTEINVYIKIVWPGPIIWLEE
ncbi:MAG: PKD domain-containing protein [Candidatus Bipolaricaulota bacterium]|nr:MAG: PKD domain-containing protein [Candidatus Bipolaricaulota bacterium]